MQNTNKTGQATKVAGFRTMYDLGLAAFVLLGLLILPAVLAKGYTFKKIADFMGTNGEPPDHISTTGANPVGDLVVSGSTLYGATELGGDNNKGTVFSVPTTVHNGIMITVLASFNGANGEGPTGDLTLSGNTLYGTTYSGGAYKKGTVFSVPAKGGKITVLASFNGTNGKNPHAGMVLSGSTLYGTASSGGANSYGTVYSVPAMGGKIAVLASFNGANGEDPRAGLVVSGRTLYGTTYSGGANSYGTVYSVPITGGTPIILARFNGANGSEPDAGLTLSGSILYGTTSHGGASGLGVVFSLPITGGIPTVLASFNGANGIWPSAGLTLNGSTLYGTTALSGDDFGGGNQGNGTVFSVPITGGDPTVVASFTNTNWHGINPEGGLTLSGSTLYGTTYQLGGWGGGTVFSLTLAPQAFSVVSVGLLLGVIVILGGIVIATKRVRSQGKA